MSPARIGADRLSMWSWVVYDLANTIFALGVVGRYFPQWLPSMGQPDSALAVVEAVAGIAVIFLAPWAGARGDARGKRLPTLRVTTVVAVAATAFLAAFSVDWTLVLLGVALVAFNIGSVAYDALLVDVSTPENRGRISGLGVAIGYIGSFVGLGIGLVTLEVLDWSYSATFVVLALGFLVFALPAFMFIEERGGDRRRSPAPLQRCGREDGRLLAGGLPLPGHGAFPGREVSLHRRHKHADRRVPDDLRPRGVGVRERLGHRAARPGDRRRHRRVH